MSVQGGVMSTNDTAVWVMCAVHWWFTKLTQLSGMDCFMIWREDPAEKHEFFTGKVHKAD